MQSEESFSHELIDLPAVSTMRRKPCYHGDGYVTWIKVCMKLYGSL